MLLYRFAQVENEYGAGASTNSSPCDSVYMKWLNDLMRSILGDNVVFFTCDNLEPGALDCSAIEGVLPTLNFKAGLSATNIFRDLLRPHNPTGPLVNSEFYPGWVDHWGMPHDENVWHYNLTLQTTAEMMDLNASFTYYPFRGGTSYGFMPGSNLFSTFMPVTTTYDFDSPLDEAGDPTEKYYKIRDLLGTVRLFSYFDKLTFHYHLLCL